MCYTSRDELARERNLVFVHPFDDPDVIAGQGTIAMEILRQHHGDSIDAIFVPVGGGGLISGIAAYAKSLYPRIKIIGVEPEDSAGMYESLRAGRRLTLDRVGTFADGVATFKVGSGSYSFHTDAQRALFGNILDEIQQTDDHAGDLAAAGDLTTEDRTHIGDSLGTAKGKGPVISFEARVKERNATVIKNGKTVLRS